MTEQGRPTEQLTVPIATHQGLLKCFNTNMSYPPVQRREWIAQISSEWASILCVEKKLNPLDEVHARRIKVAFDRVVVRQREFPAIADIIDCMPPEPHRKEPKDEIDKDEAHRRDLLCRFGMHWGRREFQRYLAIRNVFNECMEDDTMSPAKCMNMIISRPTAYGVKLKPMPTRESIENVVEHVLMEAGIHVPDEPEPDHHEPPLSEPIPDLDDKSEPVPVLEQDAKDIF